MHILVVNDDGPPSPHSSPYVHSLVLELQKAGHTVSVCLPHTQRSWIGKAHMIGKTLTPTYYRPPPSSSSSSSSALPAGLGNADDADAHGSTHARPARGGGATEEWVLVDGTPASCVQIGLYHFFQDRGNFDLVVSGPNYGRNTTAAFALSSGTLGGALEAAVCRKKAIALSYAFFSRNHDPEIVAGASRHSVRVIEALVRQWPEDGSVDVYSVNVPLVEGVEKTKTLFAPCLQNYWSLGNSAFEAVASEEDPDREEEKIREGEIGGSTAENGPEGERRGGHEHKHFKWAPQLGDVMKATQEASPAVDGRVVTAGNTSVTPFKANFWHAATHLHEQELKLNVQESTTPLPVRVKASGHSLEEDTIHAIVDYDDPYVQPIIISALQSLVPPHRLRLLPPTSSHTDVPQGAKFLQIRAYESLDFEHAMSNPATSMVNSYVIRKALIRKHFLSSTVDHWVAKHPDSVLKGHVKRGEAFEVDYAEFLDDALIEAFDLRASLERNEERAQIASDERGDASSSSSSEWWILKPSMSDRGQGIRLFSTMEELQGIFDGWEADAPDSDVEEEEENDSDNAGEKDYITTSDLRYFVAQPYIHPPLLLPSCERRKFHIRTYVLCAGAMKVYVCREMLALFAARPYAPPWENTSQQDDKDYDYLDAHLTNTCLQGPRADENSVKRFWDLADEDLPPAEKEGIFAQICAVTGDIFEAAAREMMVHFQPLPFAFEVYGLDFLVDAEQNTWLLEVNAFPDFKQTGHVLREQVVAAFWREALNVGVGPWAGIEEREKATDGNERMVLVRSVDLGRR
ncbi:hypothetical protein N0V82_008167 [Gnomoniopsis sp. IMI 355080]|nr:hypothetical protein N0V82_008167 [Gnomoniopsis sp. IMI 355080]